MGSRARHAASDGAECKIAVCTQRLRLHDVWEGMEEWSGGKSVIRWRGDESLERVEWGRRVGRVLREYFGGVNLVSEEGRGKGARRVGEGGKCPVAIRLHALQTCRRP